MGNFGRNAEETIGNQYKNAFLETFGEILACSSTMMVCSRADVHSGNGITQDTKPQLLFGSNVTESDMSKTCGFRMSNEFYEEPTLTYMIKDKPYHTFYSDGSIGLKNLTTEPWSPNNTLALINGVLKFKDNTGIWKTINMS